jgi:5-methylcytosine-specific restriction endonuclease McrA
LEHFEGDTKNKYRMKLKAKKWLENTQTIKDDINEEVQEILKILGVE